MPNYSSHRPHCKGRDYFNRGIYLITLVVRNRDHLLGELNMDIKHPGVNLTPLGEAVLDEWKKTPDIHRQQMRHISIYAQSVMPDHFHGVLFFEHTMDISVGQVMWGFKAACTKRWKALLAPLQPNSAANSESPATDFSQSQPSLAAGPDLHAMSHAQRARYYASLPREQQPLFDDNYDDSCLWSYEQYKPMLAYVEDNPRREIIKALVPQFMQKRVRLVINGVRYSAFGNLLLLRKPIKRQVFCHRIARIVQLSEDERMKHGYSATTYHPDTKSSIPYTQTQAWQHERDTWIKEAQDGAVLVTPGISPGELEMKNIAIRNRLQLIHLQKEPIIRKPEGERFFACADGSLLILAPWKEDLEAIPSQLDTSDNTDFDRFHNMNLLAKHICEMETTELQLSFKVME